MTSQVDATKIDLSEADELVSYDINAMSIEELRGSIRAHILSDEIERAYADELRAELRELTIEHHNVVMKNLDERNAFRLEDESNIRIINRLHRVCANRYEESKRWRRLSYAAVAVSVLLTFKLLGVLL